MANILVVDDDAHYSDYLSTLLTRAGFECRVVQSAEAALKCLDTQGFDAIISDLYMPEMDGIEFAMRIFQTHGDIPLFILAGETPELFAILSRSASRYGVSHFLKKPVEPDFLIDALTKAIQGLTPRC